MTTWRIRPGTAQDLESLLALAACCPEAPQWTRPEYAAMLFAMEEGKGGKAAARQVLVAELKGRLCGFAVGYVADNDADAEGELENVAVAQEDRCKGLGQALVAEVLRWGAERGIRTCVLEVRSRSTGAIRLYERVGFRRVGFRRGYYRDPADDAHVMRIELDASTLEV